MWLKINGQKREFFGLEGNPRGNENYQIGLLVRKRREYNTRSRTENKINILTPETDIMVDKLMRKMV